MYAIRSYYAFYKGSQISDAAASTMAFATLCLARLFHGFNCRSNKSIFRIGLTTNVYSLFAFFGGIALLASALLIPPLQHLFECAPLGWDNIGFIALMAFAPTLLIQIKRVIFEFVRK